MRRNTLRVFAFSALASVAAAQTFDVASVKPAAPDSRYSMKGGPGTSDPGQITYSKVTLKSLLLKAYDIGWYELAAPSWVDEAKYDIVAKVAPGTTKEQLQQMLRNLLTERFRLVVHRETKELRVYALVVGKNGPKLKVSGTETDADSTEGPPVTSVSLSKDGLPAMPAGYKGHVIGMTVAGKTMLRAKGESVKDFAKMLSDLLDRPVLDLTNLTDKYDFGIAWSADQTVDETDLPPGLEPGADVFTAFQVQLGLKLEPRRLPVDMVVVDSLERAPTTN